MCGAYDLLWLCDLFLWCIFTLRSFSPRLTATWGLFSMSCHVLYFWIAFMLPPACESKEQNYTSAMTINIVFHYNPCHIIMGSRKDTIILWEFLLLLLLFIFQTFFFFYCESFKGVWGFSVQNKKRCYSPECHTSCIICLKGSEIKSAALLHISLHLCVRRNFVDYWVTERRKQNGDLVLHERWKANILRTVISCRYFYILYRSSGVVCVQKVFVFNFLSRTDRNSGLRLIW